MIGLAITILSNLELGRWSLNLVSSQVNQFDILLIKLNILGAMSKLGLVLLLLDRLNCNKGGQGSCQTPNGPEVRAVPQLLEGLADPVIAPLALWIPMSSLYQIRKEHYSRQVES